MSHEVLLECDASSHRFHCDRGLTRTSRPLEKLARWHRPNFLPVLENPSASRRRLELCRTRAAGRAPARTLVRGIEYLVNTARELTRLRSTFCNRVYLFGSRIRIHRKVPRRVRSYAAGFWKSECIVIGDQDCISGYTSGHRLSVVHAASQLPGSR